MATLCTSSQANYQPTSLLLSVCDDNLAPIHAKTIKHHTALGINSVNPTYPLDTVLSDKITIEIYQLAETFLDHRNY